MAGLDDTLALEAVYYAAPIPRDLATLTVLGAVFDKVYFPGVYLPKDGFDEAALDREIARLEALPDARTDYDTALLIGVLKLAKHTRTLDGFCVFTNTRDRAGEPGRTGADFVVLSGRPVVFCGGPGAWAASSDRPALR